MTDGVTSFTASGTITYHITITNNGPSDVTSVISDVIFKDAKPSQVASWTWTCGTTGLGAACSGSGGSIMIDFTDNTIKIPVGGSVGYTVVAVAVGSPTGPMINTAIINYPASAIFPDPDTSNNSVTDTNSAP
jgi:uncharacterized repeat protein (TIGR01451 family)